jgi:hypothetical protein
LTCRQILGWADQHRRRTGAWPRLTSGPIPGTEENWLAVNVALQQGHRGLPGNSSLARLLASHRGVRNRGNLPPLSEAQILAWADAHCARAGHWPIMTSGLIPRAGGEKWLAVDAALRHGCRGLPEGSSLAQLLAERRQVRNCQALPALRIDQILAWADAHYQRTARWPLMGSGSIAEAAGETWLAVDAALRTGRRGLPGGSSLARLLETERGKRNHLNLRRLTEGLILRWARAHRKRTGCWPTRYSGPVGEAPGEKWHNLDAALSQGLRGLPSGVSLAQLLGRGRAPSSSRRLSER